MKRTTALVILIIALLHAGGSTAAHAAPNRSFSDVPAAYWAGLQIRSLANYDVVSGGADGRFRPTESLTRSELAKLLTLAYLLKDSSASPGYTDLGSDHWSYAFVANAVAAGWLNGFPDSTFRPNSPATRAQVAKILTMANGYSTAGATTASFSDVASGYWAYPYIAAAQKNGVLGGYPDGTFRPNTAITRAEAAALIYRALMYKDYELERSTASGITYKSYRRFTGAGPLKIHVLAVPKSAPVSIALGLANEMVASREKLSSMARRKGAIAAVNADYFSLKPGGCSGIMVDGVIITSPITSRSYLGVLADKTAFIDRATMTASVTPSATGRQANISWLNKPRNDSSDTIFAYTPLFGPTTLTEDTGTETIIRLDGPITPNSTVSGTVTDVRYGVNNTPIPAGSIVLSAVNGSARQYLNANMLLGDSVSFNFSLGPNWQSGASAIGGGPRLVREGKAGVESESFTSSQINGRAPRTGVGIDAQGGFIIEVVDGRADCYSIGVTLAELAEDLQRRGAVDAMSFDGGGSSELFFNGAIRSSLSEGAERPISNALLFVPN